MNERQIFWSDKGRASAAANGVDTAEAAQALISPDRIERHVGDLLLIVAGLAETGRVITVLLNREDDSFIYWINQVFVTKGGDLEEWRAAQ